MSPAASLLALDPLLVDHTHLPDSDGSIVTNFLEHPQRILLTDAVEPVLKEVHPDHLFCIGHDNGIYWKLTDPPLDGCKSPDWYYVPGRPLIRDGQVLRSYVLWQEKIPPLLIVEFVSGDGSEERDRTPESGKFWVYENAIKARYYAIYEFDPGQVEVYELIDGEYRLMEPNERGHFPIPPMNVELGIWQGKFKHDTLPWLRFWDQRGQLLLTYEERVEGERRRAERERQRAEQEQRAKQEAVAQAERERLRAEHEQLAKQDAVARAEREQQRAEQEQRAKQEAVARAERLAEQLRKLGLNPDA